MKKTFGRRSGVIRHAQGLLHYHLGYLAALAQVDPTRVRRLVFVCKGNICRSPYAEARAKRLGLAAVSAGIDACTGASANESAIRIAELRGIDLKTHSAARVDSLELDSGDLLVAFEPSQVSALAEEALWSGAQLTLLGLHSRPLRPHLEDPYGLSDAYFNTCYSLIDSGLERLASKLAGANGQA